MLRHQMMANQVNLQSGQYPETRCAERQIDVLDNPTEKGKSQADTQMTQHT